MTSFIRKVLKNPEKELDLFEHLAELRTRIIRSMVYIVIGMVVAWVFFDQLYVFLLSPAIQIMDERDGRFLQTTFAAGFTLRMQVALVGSLVLASPLLSMEFWLFVAPGLNKGERRALYFIAPLSILLFAFGVFICSISLPKALGWFVTLVPPNTELFPDVARTLIFMVQMYLAFGIIFELPVVLMFLAKIGLINSRLMVQMWREAIVGSAVIGAVFTPSPDAFTMLMMAVPLIGLYFLSIILVRWVED